MSILLAFWLIPTALFSQVFYDGFESGTYLPTWSDGAGAYTRTVTNVAPAVGTYSFEITGGASSHYDGIIGNWGTVQATEIGWWVKGTATAFCGYVVVGDASVTSNNGMVFSRLSDNGNINFYADAGNQYNYPIVTNTWHHVELKNIDWTNKVFDIFVDGVSQFVGFPFRDPATTGLSEAHFYNYALGTAYLDDFTVGTCNIPDVPVLTYSPTTVCNGDDATITIAGNLNDATEWAVYTALCGGTYVGSTMTNTFVVTPPSIGDTYYVRGEDGAGCVNEALGLCSASTIVVFAIDVSTSVTDLTISANNSGATYQWIDCMNNSPISGETNQSYTATANGDYAVVLNEGNCSDTSACVTINSVGIDQLILESFVLYPNPSKNGLFSVKIDGEIKAIELIDMLGRLIQVPTNLQKGSVNASELESGKYIVRVTIGDDKVLMKEIVIQK